jgi:uncharacterized membrane protein YsdA (DUF1294 family)
VTCAHSAVGHCILLRELVVGGWVGGWVGVNALKYNANHPLCVYWMYWIITMVSKIGLYKLVSNRCYTFSFLDCIEYHVTGEFIN